ncbi:hypothetical protein SLS58_006009 [Diplodia intermedia]|uniref:Rhodopsin domain-containing protein n=1 Tax=Diplodia intermedia TaxID=856260 RepID=A0ABR3TPS3_9PEZI
MVVRDIPLSILFTWPQPNYVDPVTRGPALIIINAVFISLCTLLLFLRLYTRIFIKRWFGSDDVFIILAYMSTVGMTITVIVANKQYYWDRHMWDVPMTAFTGVLKVAFSAKLIFVYAATFTRQSLLCFYYRLVADTGIRWFGWVLHLTVFLNVAGIIAFTCLGIWQCNPISAYWTLSTPAGAYCIDEGKTILGVGIVNCVLDLVVTILPIPLVRKLQMPVQQRIGVMALLSLGLVVVVAGVARTYYIWKGLIESYDETWYTFPLWIAAAVEVNLGIRCIAPAFSNFGSRISSLKSGSSSPGSNTLQNSQDDRGNRSYQRFPSNSKDSTDPASNSTADIKEMGGKLPLATRRGVKHPFITDHGVDNKHDDDDETSFIPLRAGVRHRRVVDDDDEEVTNGDEQHAAVAYNTTARLSFVTLPPHSPLSPLQITRRRSFQLVSLDRRRFSAEAAAAAAADNRGSSPFLSPHQHDQEQQPEHLELDPREKNDAAAFGCQTRVSCADDGGEKGDADGVGGGGRKERGVFGMGWRWHV